MPNRLETAREKIMSRVAAANPDFEVISYWPILWDRYPVACCRWLSQNTIRIGWYMGTEPEPRATAELEAIAAPDGTASARLAVTGEPTLDGLVDSVEVSHQSEIGPKSFNRERYQGLEIDFRLSLEVSQSQTIADVDVRYPTPSQRNHSLKHSLKFTPEKSVFETVGITGLEITAIGKSDWDTVPKRDIILAMARDRPDDTDAQDYARIVHEAHEPDLGTMTKTNLDGSLSSQINKGANADREGRWTPNSPDNLYNPIRQVSVAKTGNWTPQTLVEQPMRRIGMPDIFKGERYEVLVVAKRELPTRSVPARPGMTYRIIDGGLNPKTGPGINTTEVELTANWEMYSLGHFEWPLLDPGVTNAQAEYLDIMYQMKNTGGAPYVGGARNEFLIQLNAVFIIPSDLGYARAPAGTITKDKSLIISNVQNTPIAHTKVGTDAPVRVRNIEHLRGWSLIPTDAGKRIAVYCLGADGTSNWQRLSTTLSGSLTTRQKIL